MRVREYISQPGHRENGVTGPIGLLFTINIDPWRFEKTLKPNAFKTRYILDREIIYYEVCLSLDAGE